MQPHYNQSTPQSRPSYGFSNQDSFHPRPPNKGFPLTPNTFPLTPGAFPHHHSDPLSHAIKSLESKNEFADSPIRKKLQPGESSPLVTAQMGQFAAMENRFKPQFAANGEGGREEASNEQFLRGSCSNLLKKFDSSTNLGSSLRNTTTFNAKSKFPTAEMKKSSEDCASFKTSHILKSNLHDNSSFLRGPERAAKGGAGGLSRTPTKLFADKNESLQSGSRTPVKYRNVFEKGNKDSNISKGSTEPGLPGSGLSGTGTGAGLAGGEKKVFKSLNEIVAVKAKEKQIVETGRSLRKRSKVVNGFEIGAVLGRGKFGEVFLGRQGQAGFVVALKRVEKAKVVENKMVDQFCSEIRLHSCLDHPNIVRFYGCFEEGGDVCLVMEYMNGGTLFDYLNQVSCLSLRETVDFLRDIIEALVYMHEKSIAHRDIKPENIVISSEGVAKLCDFGWAAVVETSRKTYCGTFDYAPPEILERKNYDSAVDIWCIGVLAYELLTGRVPFEGEQRTEVREKILNVDKQKFDYSVEVVPEAKQFIEALVQKDPALRPKSQDLLKFPLFALFPGKGKHGNPKRPQ